MRYVVVLLCSHALFVHNVNAQDITTRAATQVPTLPTSSSEQSSSVATRASSAQQSSLGGGRGGPGVGVSTAQTISPNVKAEQTYFIQFTEFRFKHSLDVKRTASEIVESFDQWHQEGKIELIETVRMTALEYHESTAQFGKTTTLTTGVTRTAQGIQQRSMQSVPIGTVVRVTATPQESKVLLKVAYDVSRIDDSVSEEKQPDTVKIQLNTTLLLEIGKAKLVGGMTSDTNDFLMVKISN